MEKPPPPIIKSMPGVHADNPLLEANLAGRGIAPQISVHNPTGPRFLFSAHTRVINPLTTGPPDEPPPPTPEWGASKPKRGRPRKKRTP